MTLIEELKQRGFIHQCTNEKALSDLLNSESIKFYIGFDCTAKSLHVGSLIPNNDHAFISKIWAPSYCFDRQGNN